MRGVLVDAGPLIALLDSSDRHHEACREALSRFRGPLLTVWPVLAEASHALGDVRAQTALLDMAASGALWLLELGATDAKRLGRLMERYADLPMDLADAALVAVAERDELDTIFTLDRRDFSVYRMKGGRALKLFS